MGNWNDPDIRNHVTGDDTLRYNLFLVPNVFYNEPMRIFNPYIEKDMRSHANMIYKSVDNEQRDKYHRMLEEVSPRYRFAYTSNLRAMQDSYFAIGNIYLYQLILGINNLWTILDYTDSNIPRIYVPTKSQITSIFRGLLTERNYHNMHELNNEEEIRRALEDLIINTEVDYTLVRMVSDKLHISIPNAIRRLKSPLITKYLSRSISKMIVNRSSINDRLLVKTITNMLHKLKVYIRDNSDDEDSGAQ